MSSILSSNTFYQPAFRLSSPWAQRSCISTKKSSQIPMPSTQIGGCSPIPTALTISWSPFPKGRAAASASGRFLRSHPLHGTYAGHFPVLLGARCISSLQTSLGNLIFLSTTTRMLISSTNRTDTDEPFHQTGRLQVLSIFFARFHWQATHCQRAGSINMRPSSRL